MSVQGANQPTAPAVGRAQMNGNQPAVGGLRAVTAGEERVFYRYYEGGTRSGVRYDNTVFGTGFYMAVPKSVEGIVIDPSHEVYGFGDEFKALTDALKGSHCVTLLGPPGSGKNMVASLYCYKYGPRAEQPLYDYIVPVQLGQDGDIGRVALAAARQLRPDIAAPATREEALTLLLQCLRYKRFLLLLDQFAAIIDPYTDTLNDPAYEALLTQALTGGVGGSRLLLLARSDFVLEARGYGRYSDFVELPKMKLTDSEILLKALAPAGIRLDRDVCDNIAQKTAGNPLLMSAMMSQLANYPTAGLEEVIDHGGWRTPLYLRYDEVRASLPQAEREALELLSVADEDRWALSEVEMVKLAQEASFIAGRNRPPGTLFHSRIDGREIKQALLGLRHRLMVSYDKTEIRLSQPLSHYMRISMNARDRRLYHRVMANYYNPADRKDDDLELWFEDIMHMVRHLIKADLLGDACEIMCRKQVHDYAVGHPLMAVGRYVELGSQILFARMGDGQPTPEPAPPWRALLAYRLGKVLEGRNKRRARAMYEEAKYWLEHSDGSQRGNRDLYLQVMKALGGVNYLHRSVTGSHIPTQREAPTITGRLAELPPQSQNRGIIWRKPKLC